MPPVSPSPPPYPDSDFDLLLTSIAGLELTPRATKVPITSSQQSALPVAPAASSLTLYRYKSPTNSGYTHHWDKAADASQGILGGPYNAWDQVRPLVDGVSGSLFQGYDSIEEARAAFQYAEERSWTRDCTSPRPPSSWPASLVPQPTGFLDAPNPLHTGLTGSASRGHRWYVVFRGITPGVYQSSPECGLNTCGLSGAVHKSYLSKPMAVAEYQNALAGGRVKIISPLESVTPVETVLFPTFIMPSSRPRPTSPSDLTQYQLMQRKKEEQRAKTRACMARYRSKLKDPSLEDQEAAVIRAREARARYRERNRLQLLHTAKCKQQAAYAEKYGVEAYGAKMELKQQRQKDKQDHPRCRDRVKPSKSSDSRDPDLDESDNDTHSKYQYVPHPYQYVYPVSSL
ncbi:hypothetical protein B0H13DRAFT_2342687 [Mycena leptocephala]|nr:hypothetical protein B0H13DRAFT_2342687 [Mycena leptocephala]